MDYKPTEEAVLAFFDGFSKNCYLVYGAKVGGLGLPNDMARERWERKSNSFFKMLIGSQIHHMALVDANEISLELSMNKTVEDLLCYFWTICGVIGKESELTSVAGRTEFLRPISDEVIIAYFLGLSWLFKKDEPNREERIIKFLRLVKERMNLKIEVTQIVAMSDFFYDDLMFEELRLIAIDHFGVRHCVTGRPLKSD